MSVKTVVRDLVVDIRITPAEFVSLAADWMNTRVERYKGRMNELKGALGEEKRSLIGGVKAFKRTCCGIILAL